MENEWKGPYSVIEKCDETTYKLNMPDHPRRRVKRHVNLLREFVSPTAGCMFVYTESELDFGPSIEEKGSRPIVSDRLTNEKKQIDQLMIEFGGLMQGQPGLTRAAEISIETGSAHPISRPPYRLDSVKSKAMDDAVRELLGIGIVRPSRSPWASPALLVAKRDGTNRLCVDYRKLKSITVSDPFPLSLIGELLDRLGKATYITTLDLVMGYHQVPVQTDSIPKTAFITSRGKWEYTRMPFGLKKYAFGISEDDECYYGQHHHLCSSLY